MVPFLGKYIINQSEFTGTDLMVVNDRSKQTNCNFVSSSDKSNNHNSISRRTTTTEMRLFLGIMAKPLLHYCSFHFAANKAMIDRVGDIKCLFCLLVCSRASCKCHAIYHVTFLTQPTTIYKWTVD